MSASGPSRRFRHLRYFRFGWERTLVNRNARGKADYSWQQPVIRRERARAPHDASSSSNALASLRSSVSKPSVNQLYTGARSSRACCGTVPAVLERATDTEASAADARQRTHSAQLSLRQGAGQVAFFSGNQGPTPGNPISYWDRPPD
jgi:DNA-binding transcriptional regulator YdaS (Cro superfamily)